MSTNKCDKVNQLNLGTNQIKTISKNASTAFVCPSDIAIDTDGIHSIVYVSDPCTSSVQQINVTSGVVKVIASSYKFSMPLSVTTDSNGNVYVADAGNFRVVRITKSGQVSNVVRCGYTQNIRVVGNYLYVADQENNRIDIVDLRTKLVVKSVIGSSFSPKFVNISSISIYADGDLVVGDSSAYVSAHQLRLVSNRTNNSSLTATEAPRLGVLQYPR